MNDAADNLVSAKQSFRLGTQMVQQGQVFTADDLVVTGREHLFEPVSNRVRTTASVGRPVESPPPAVEPAVEPDDEGVVRPAGNASRDKWAAYVAAIGGEVAEDATRGDLVALADTLEGGD